MSYLTQSYEELQREVIAALESETGLTFTPKTETVTEFYARCLGQTTLWGTKDEGELLALLNTDNGGSTVSDKTYSYAQLLDTLNTTLGGGGGGGGDEGDEDMALISQLTISSPQSYVDITLPAGYDVFRMTCIGVCFDNGTNTPVADSLDFAVSMDGGSTFINNTDDYDSYASHSLFSADQGSGYLPIAGPFGTSGLDALGYLTWNGIQADFALPMLAETIIFPGSASQYFLTKTVTTHGLNDSQPFNNEITGSHLLQVGRANLMRLQPYGNGDAAPPTSAKRIHKGMILLYGTPSA